MKNLVNIKDAFFRGVKHCGKAMLLLVALTALSGSAWAAKISVYCGSGQPNLYSWKASDDNVKYAGNWPGTAMTQMSSIDNSWYQYTIENGSDNYNVIWNQTVDNKAYQTNNLEANTSGDVVGWFYTTSESGESGERAKNGAFYNMSEVKFYGNHWGNWNNPVAMDGFDSDKLAYYHLEENLPAGTYTFRVKWNEDWQEHTVSTTRGNYAGIVKDGDNAKVVLNNAGSIKFYFDPGNKQLFADVIEIPTPVTTPTVLISKSEKVEGQEVTLSGYLKYTGCKNINNVGFIISQDEEKVEDGTAQVYNATTAPDAPIAAMSDFSLFSDEFENEVTYYYKAWMKASDETVTLSEETRSFTPAGVCSITDAASVLPIFESGKITESATFASGSASINLKVDKNCIADVYQWNVESQPTGGNATFSPGNKRNTSVTVNAVGTYTFTLTAGCAEGPQFKSSRVLTLYVCEPAEATQLYLDNHTDNVLCAGEKATATCITKEGYTYSLYSPSGDNLGSLAGTGGTQTWRNVTGAGEFTMRTSPTSLPQCAAVVSSATQRYNEPLLEITAEPALSVLSYQPVTLSKKDVESPTYVDTDPTWVITDGSDKAYLLNEHNRLAYDNRARESVVFKAGAGSATQITVEASAYKTVEVPDASGNYTKQCPATVDVTLTVSPAKDDCD